MIKYKAKCDCVIARSGISVQVTKDTIWTYLGCIDDHVTLNRQNVCIDISKDRMDRLFRELKEQKGE